MSKDKLKKSIVYKGFKKVLIEEFGKEKANEIWKEANKNLSKFENQYADIKGDEKMMILPAAALYVELRKEMPDEALDILKKYGKEIGEKIAKVIHSFTSIPGVSKILWKNMPKLMRKSSSEKKGYTRKIVSETKELVGVDIISCPLHNAAIKIGMPEVAQIVCAMDKAYMSGFKYINYTRTTSVAEGDSCCDYRLSYDKNKK
ncbi:MAG: L-2-amino-thiazoline-4-carboxylic acid hydrolase [Clostridia bacterium]|nr:L-2-amino-thiazoline-4-carboxylic acid hydrolase [Clostridia bacterium]